MKKAGIGRDERVMPGEHVRYRQFDDELVMVDLEGGEYFALDAMGKRMWDALVSGKSPAEVAASLVPEYDADEEDIVRDCVALTEDLVDRGLLVVKREP